MTNGPIVTNQCCISFTLRYAVSDLQAAFKTDACILKLSDPSDFCN